LIKYVLSITRPVQELILFPRFSTSLQRLLSNADFHRLADVPPVMEGFANMAEESESRCQVFDQ
jgi:hypothetical protein